MTQLQTIVPNPPASLKLSHQRPLLLIGSCFTEHISDRLSDSGFRVLANPFGILYNPLSIAQCLQRCRQGEPITNHDLVLHDGLFHSWLHHSRFSQPTEEACLSLCNDALLEAHEFLKQDPVVILTLGTAYAYELPGYGIVSNCHKVPASRFSKQLVSIDHSVQTLSQSLQGLDSIITISPIRHWADTPHGNQLSKSTLLLAAEKLPSHYFPAYEIMMDELRDYRFYDLDMIHPSSLAVDIIWDRFCHTYFTDSTLALALKHQQLHRMQAHRPLFPDSPAYKAHLHKIDLLQQELNDLLLNPETNKNTHTS